MHSTTDVLFIHSDEQLSRLSSLSYIPTSSVAVLCQVQLYMCIGTIAAFEEVTVEYRDMYFTLSFLYHDSDMSCDLKVQRMTILGCF